MEGLTLILLILSVGLAFGLAVFILRQNKNEYQNENGSAFSLLKQDISEKFQGLEKELKQTREDSIRFLQGQLKEGRTAANQQLQESGRLIEHITKELSEISSTNKQVVSVAEQLRGLEDILKNPKQRGILGEYYLEELLKNVFPPSQYQMQYKFKDGAIVDAVIFAKDKKIIPIDSKFSLENYNKIISEKDPIQKEKYEKLFKQDLKNRIDETAKYIRPDEGTLSFAFMFIPAEAIYYDLLVNKVGAVQANTRALIEYAVRDKAVHIVSPTSFYAYLQTILQGLRAFQVEQSAMEIRKGVEMLGKHILSYDSYMKKLGNSLSTTCNTYNTAYKELNKIDKDIVKITGQEKGIEPFVIDKPDILE